MSSLSLEYCYHFTYSSSIRFHAFYVPMNPIIRMTPQNKIGLGLVSFIKFIFEVVLSNPIYYSWCPSTHHHTAHLVRMIWKSKVCLLSVRCSLLKKKLKDNLQILNFIQTYIKCWSKDSSFMIDESMNDCLRRIARITLVVHLLTFKGTQMLSHKYAQYELQNNIRDIIEWYWGFK